ncbi:MAG: hypothetical protein ABS939_15740 [Psychrobacillus sp.]
MGFEEVLTIVMEAIKQFGFPIVVAGWALWRLDKNWAKGESIQFRLDQIEEGLDRVEMAMTKQAEIQQETLLTIKILHTVLSPNNGGGDK